MSAVTASQALRAGVQSALREFLAERSQTEVGALCDIDPTTVYRRGPDLSAWPCSHVLALAVLDEGLRRALQLYLDGTARPAGDAVRALPDLFSVLERCGALVAEAAGIVADGQVDRGEARRALLALRDARRLFEEAERNLRPIAHGTEATP
jgi:hypothetical protein